MMEASRKSRPSRPSPTHANTGVTRVSSKRKCLICGRPDWCGYTADGQLSFCMRISAGSVKTAENGAYIHVHGVTATPAPSNGSRPRRRANKPTLPVAPLEVRDAVYRELIRLSPCTLYPELIEGKNGLRSRGLLPEDFANFGSLPASPSGRAALARELRMFVRSLFPRYAEETAYAGVVGVPGFWQDTFGAVQLWLSYEESGPMLLIPYRDGEGHIQACQLRRSGEIPDKVDRYTWLSTPKKNKGVSSGTPIHFTFSPGECAADSPILITEGALKATAFRRLRPLAYVLATSGVTCSHRELVEATRGRKALIAFDADHRTNMAVCRQIARLVAARALDAAEHGHEAPSRVVVWDTVPGRKDKGVDDAALLQIQLKSLHPFDWHRTLQQPSFDEVNLVWSEAGFNASSFDKTQEAA
ncbi:MAG: hypothetical protein ACJ74Q_15835 [Pyrinomonadaceae bacterium]